MAGVSSDVPTEMGKHRLVLTMTATTEIELYRASASVTLRIGDGWVEESASWKTMPQVHSCSDYQSAIAHFENKVAVWQGFGFYIREPIVGKEMGGLLVQLQEDPYDADAHERYLQLLNRIGAPEATMFERLLRQVQNNEGARKAEEEELVSICLPSLTSLLSGVLNVFVRAGFLRGVQIGAGPADPDSTVHSAVVRFALREMFRHPISGLLERMTLTSGPSHVLSVLQQKTQPPTLTDWRITSSEFTDLAPLAECCQSVRKLVIEGHLVPSFLSHKWHDLQALKMRWYPTDITLESLPAVARNLRRLHVVGVETEADLRRLSEVVHPMELDELRVSSRFEQVEAVYRERWFQTQVHDMVPTFRAKVRHFVLETNRPDVGLSGQDGSWCIANRAPFDDFVG